MARYDPLRDCLRKQKLAEFELSFAEIERKIGYMLPNSASQPQWWANTAVPDKRYVQRKAWGEAGYDAYLIAGSDRVRFSRKASPPADHPPKSNAI